jgi:hypothetical protein
MNSTATPTQILQQRLSQQRLIADCGLRIADCRLLDCARCGPRRAARFHQLVPYRHMSSVHRTYHRHLPLPPTLPYPGLRCHQGAPRALRPRVRPPSAANVHTMQQRPTSNESTTHVYTLLILIFLHLFAATLVILSQTQRERSYRPMAVIECTLELPGIAVRSLEFS